MAGSPNLAIISSAIIYTPPGSGAWKLLSRAACMLRCIIVDEGLHPLGPPRRRVSRL